MKKFLLTLVGCLTLGSCAKKGTVENIGLPNNGINVYRYYYEDGAYIYVAHFKDQPNVITTTQTGKDSKPTVTIFENDSIIIQQKNVNGR